MSRIILWKRRDWKGKFVTPRKERDCFVTFWKGRDGFATLRKEIGCYVPFRKGRD